MVNLIEVSKRRDQIMKKLGKGLLIVNSLPEATYSNDVEFKYRQHTDVLYFTGFPEPGTTCILENDGDKVIYHLFVRKRDKLKETWNGRRFGTEGALEKFKADHAYENGELEKILSDLFKKYENVYHELGNNNLIDELIISTFQKAFKAQDKTVKGSTALINPAFEIHELRSIKSPYEIELLRKAAKISAEAHTRAMAVSKPGMFEYQIEALIDYEFRKNGSKGPAYPSIVGGGINGTILHYIENQDELEDNELLLVDAGAEFDSYAADITRTWPINGKFTEPQKEIYQMVLDVQLACIAMVKPGVKFWDINEKSIELITKGLIKKGILKGEYDKIIEDKGYKRFYPHGLGHWLGIDTHDTSYIDRKTELLKPGHYFTIEPGIYITDEDDIPEKYRGIAVRIEDDILVTEEGYEILTSDVVKEIDQVEKLVGSQVLP